MPKANSRKPTKLLMEVVVERVYQRSGGGKPIAPGARSQNHYDFNATVCQTGVLKLAYGSARDVQRDLVENHAVQ